MSSSIVGGILDNDPKGKSGRGTQFWLEVTVNGEFNRYEYFLLDVLEKKFDPSSVIDAARKAMAEERKEQEQAEKAMKQAALQKREESVTVSDDLADILKTIIASNPRPVAEYQSGKEKALNSLVGLVIKEVKARGISVSDGAFTITTLLKKSLAA
jgi:Asp-tRNA(Asn)/Glu-tRNA(Gln) amidotransferase B subunit